MSMYCARIVFLQNIYGLDLANATLWHSHLNMKRIHPNRCSSNMLTEDAWCQALKMSYCIAGNLLKFRCDWMLIDLTSCKKNHYFLFSPIGRQGLGCFELREEWLTSWQPWGEKKRRAAMLRPRGWADLFWANDCIFITTSHQYMIYNMHRSHSGQNLKKHRVYLRLTPWKPQSKGPVSAEVFGAFGVFRCLRCCHSSRVWPWKGWNVRKRWGGTWPRKLQVAACCYVWTFFFHLLCPIFSTTGATSQTNHSCMRSSFNLYICAGDDDKDVGCASNIQGETEWRSHRIHVRYRYWYIYLGPTFTMKINQTCR